ncbi:MAG: hypothetical protein WAV51_02015 [Microgenomates group bacterium]
MKTKKFMLRIDNAVYVVALDTEKGKIVLSGSCVQGRNVFTYTIVGDHLQLKMGYHAFLNMTAEEVACMLGAPLATKPTFLETMFFAEGFILFSFLILYQNV